jgi:RNA polymerase sigma-70 factor, ECF subfamily
VSTPPQRRALALPIFWSGSPARSINERETAVLRCPTDEEMMARLQASDSDALHILFDRYACLVFSIALRIVHDRGEAEDVVQDAFFYLYEKSILFDRSKGTAKAWIVRVAYHRALDRKLHLARRGFYRGTDITSVDDTLLGKTDLDREIGSKLNRVQLEKAFDELAEVQRRTLELFYFEGFELREIAEKLHESLGNVRHHLYRGLERLRKSVFVQKIRRVNHVD